MARNYQTFDTPDPTLDIDVAERRHADADAAIRMIHYPLLGAAYDWDEANETILSEVLGPLKDAAKHYGRTLKREVKQLTQPLMGRANTVRQIDADKLLTLLRTLPNEIWQGCDIVLNEFGAPIMQCPGGPIPQPPIPPRPEPPSEPPPEPPNGPPTEPPGPNGECPPPVCIPLCPMPGPPPIPPPKPPQPPPKPPLDCAPADGWYCFCGTSGDSVVTYLHAGECLDEGATIVEGPFENVEDANEYCAQLPEDFCRETTPPPTPEPPIPGPQPRPPRPPEPPAAEKCLLEPRYNPAWFELSNDAKSELEKCGVERKESEENVSPTKGKESKGEWEILSRRASLLFGELIRGC